MRGVVLGLRVQGLEFKIHALGMFEKEVEDQGLGVIRVWGILSGFCT